ncbi:MAG: efflux RND transporter periplasmic adaptor subunit [Kyrpidia sp.]|nr:efflux RND transporter periplasmic adaptor subunit [Kyrpidia sp.]
MRRLLLLNLILWLAVAAGAGTAGFFLWDRALYVRTPNARVGVDLVVVTSPAAGRLTQWTAKTGDRVSAGAVLGTEETLAAGPAAAPGTARRIGPAAPEGGDALPVVATSRTVRPRAAVRARVQSRPARGVPQAAPAPNRSPSSAPAAPPPISLISPIDGVVLYSAAFPGTVWAEGRPLAVLADVSKPFVTAYVDERLVRNVAVGKAVDVYLDAYPGTAFSGKVAGIADAAGTFFAPDVPSAAGPQETRPVERVPVRIAVDNFIGKYVVPGMNATVRIHK